MHGVKHKAIIKYFSPSIMRTLSFSSLLFDADQINNRLQLHSTSRQRMVSRKSPKKISLTFHSLPHKKIFSTKQVHHYSLFSRRPTLTDQTTNSTMRISLFLSANIISCANGFVPLANLQGRSSLMTPAPLHMSTESVSYVITGNNIDVTPSLNEYVSTKLDKIVGKISTNAINECDVHLTVNKNPKVSEKKSSRERLIINSINLH